MNRLPNGDALYGDDFWFNEAFLLLLVVLCPVAGWLEITSQGKLLLGYSLILMSIAAAVALISATRRTYLFSPSSGSMSWEIRSLFGRRSGVVPFRDISVTVEAAGGRSPLTALSSLGLRGVHAYSLMIATPALRECIWSSFQNDANDALREASQLRLLLGQSSESLMADSVAYMESDGNLAGAVAFQREAAPLHESAKV
jgi:hypothetical protein